MAEIIVICVLVIFLGLMFATNESKPKDDTNWSSSDAHKYSVNSKGKLRNPNMSMRAMRHKMMGR